MKGSARRLEKRKIGTATSTGAESPSGLTGRSPHPVSLPQFESIEFGVQYLSARCDGDFFDGVATDSRLVFLLTDIAGRRPETHAIAAEIQNVFRTRAQELFKLSDANESEGIAVLARDINRAVIEAAHGVRFAPAFLGCYNLDLNILTYHLAGHLLAVFHDGERARVLEPGGIPMGLFTHSTYEPAVLTFGQQAKLLLVTKGVSRGGPAVSDDGHIRRLLENSSTDSASEICESVLQAAYDSRNQSSRVSGFLRPRDQKYRDDLTVVALVQRSSAA